MGRVTRHKKIRKTLLYYKMQHGVVPPFNMMLDGNFMHAALQSKLFIREQIPKLLEHPTKLYVTTCVMKELGNLSDMDDTFKASLLFAKNLPRIRCQHTPSKSPSDCFVDVIEKNRDYHYMVATQDNSLRERLRKLSFVPIMLISYTILILESPCRVIAPKITDSLPGDAPVIKKRKRKGVNPLSSLKKKKKTQTQSQTQQSVLLSSAPMPTHKKTRRSRNKGKETTSIVSIEHDN